MEEEVDVVDWGNEEDELQTAHMQGDGREDAEDAVSLGGDEDDGQDFAAYQSHIAQDQQISQYASSPPQSQLDNLSQQDRQDYILSQSSHTTESPQHSRRSQSSSLGQLKHALPPKPVGFSPEFVRPAAPQATTLAEIGRAHV